jgi:integrase/recombinase XerD
MYQKLCSIDVAGQQHSDAPFAEERERYLRHCAELGATPAALCLNSNELAWIARYLDPSAGQGIDMEMFLGIVPARQIIHRGATTARRMIDVGRPWLRFLGWWREPAVCLRSQYLLDRYVAWMRDERRFTDPPALRRRAACRR